MANLHIPPFGGAPAGLGGKEKRGAGYSSRGARQGSGGGPGGGRNVTDMAGGDAIAAGGRTKAIAIERGVRAGWSVGVCFFNNFVHAVRRSSSGLWLL